MRAVACALGWAAVALSGAPAARPPNIVLIVADDLGYGELGCHGSTLHRTPHLDRLAAEGLRFTQHYAGSAVCAPSRCVLLTGRHAGQAQIRDNVGLDTQGREMRPALVAVTVTVARRLQEAGYVTACIGKWGQGDEGTAGVPWQQGFAHFFGYLHNTHGTRYYTEFIYRNAEKIVLPGNFGNWRRQYAPDLLLAEAERFVEENRERPFFLLFTPNLVHGQYVEPPREAGEPPLSGIPGVEFTPQEKAYLAMVRRLDRDVGRLVAQIDQLGLAGETLILFTSDNGNRGLEDRNAALFRPAGGFRGGKADLFEGGIKVPLIARWPGRVAAGGVTDQLSGFVDFLATACDLAGVAAGTPTDGVSVAPVLFGAAATARPPLYWELAKRDEPWVVPQQAVRDGRWKLVRVGAAPAALFDLAADPGEANDLAAPRAQEVARLTQLMRELRRDHPSFPLRAGPGFE